MYCFLCVDLFLLLLTQILDVYRTWPGGGSRAMGEAEEQISRVPDAQQRRHGGQRGKEKYHRGYFQDIQRGGECDSFFCTFESMFIVFFCRNDEYQEFQLLDSKRSFKKEGDVTMKFGSKKRK